MIEEGGLKDDRILVVYKEGWHKGVLGIVASRIVDKYYRPTVVISVEDGVGTGSARSIDGFHLHEALTSCTYFAEKAFLDSRKEKVSGPTSMARIAKLATGWAAHLFYWVYPGVMVAMMANLIGYIYTQFTVNYWKIRIPPH